MSQYLGLIKVSADEASRILRDGPTARRDHFAHLVEEAGGTLDQAWYTNVGDWDMVCLVTMTDSSPISGAAATLERRAAGLTAAERWIELAAVDDVTVALERLTNSDQ